MSQPDILVQGSKQFESKGNIYYAVLDQPLRAYTILNNADLHMDSVTYCTIVCPRYGRLLNPQYNSTKVCHICDGGHHIHVTFNGYN